MVDAPAPHTPEPEKLPVVDYDFRNDRGEIVAQITVWPTKGDTVEFLKDRAEFCFPRLETTQVIFLHLVLGMTEVKTTRVPFDLKDVQRKIEEQKKAKHVEAKSSNS
jgi:hypothetical protein